MCQIGTLSPPQNAVIQLAVRPKVGQILKVNLVRARSTFSSLFPARTRSAAALPILIPRNQLFAGG